MFKQHKGLAVAAAAALAVALAGCTDDKPATPTASTSTSPGASAGTRTAAAPAGKYTLPANMCDAVSADAFKDVAAVRGTPKEMNRMTGGNSSSATCMTNIGDLGNELILIVGVEILADTNKTSAQYEAFKGAVFAKYEGAKEVSGVGTKAYYVEIKDVGPQLVVLHGTAHLSVSLAKFGTAAFPADAQRRLTETAKTTLGKLPTA